MEPLAASCGVAVVGAGAMGAGIAQLAAVAGHPVVVIDLDAGRTAAAIAGVRTQLDRLVAKGRLDAAGAAAAGDRLSAGSSINDAADVDLVVEAVVESLEVKRALFAELEGVVGDDTILATNTSSLSVTAIAAGLRRPGRCVGMHFFNPAPVLPLVEVVSGLATDPDVAERVARTAIGWGKTPVHVTSTPGFVVNRVARPFYGEGLRAYEERVADAATIDAVLRESGGFRMGPLELTDLIGQDVNLAVSRSVWDAFAHDPRFAPSLAQQGLVDAGRLGRKSGRGFYAYGDSAPDVRPDTAGPQPRPDSVDVRGDWGPWEPLWARLDAAGVRVGRQAATAADDAHAGGGPRADLPGGALLVPTEGRSATALAARTGRPVVVLDLALDPATAQRFAVAASDGCPPAARDEVVGLLQAGGAAVSVLDDLPGLLVARTVAMLVNEAVDAVARGVATAADVDTAMRLGVNYPVGPLAWGQRLGAARVVDLLDALADTYRDGRYRACPMLRRAALSGTSLHEL